MISEQRRSWQTSGVVLEQLVDDAVDVLGDTLAQRYANVQNLAYDETVSLAILGVRSASDYARVANYLEGLDTVRDLFISNVTNDLLQVRFSARGGRAALVSSIGFGRVLSPVAGRSDAYQLMP